MKKFLPWVALLALALPTLSWAQSGIPNRSGIPKTNDVSVIPQITWSPIYFRHASAANGGADSLWAHQPIGSVRGFADSLVFRKATTSAAAAETTEALRPADWPLPPNTNNKPAVVLHTAYKQESAKAFNTGDSLVSATPDTSEYMPWVFVRIRQDTLSYGYSSAANTGALFGSATTGDTFYVAAQWSVDGQVWNSVQANPTLAFAGTLVPVVSGLADPALIVTEASPPFDEFIAPLNCVPSLFNGALGTQFIINRSLCMCSGMWVRFIITTSQALDVGQWAAEIGHW